MLQADDRNFSLLSQRVIVGIGRYVWYAQLTVDQSLQSTMSLEPRMHLRASLLIQLV